MNSYNDVRTLLETVVRGGYCIGCGACASINHSPIRIKFDEYSKMQATLDDIENSCQIEIPVLSICPFSNESLDEDKIGRELYKGTNSYVEKLGYVKASYVGYAREGKFRADGSSGGMGTWILVELFNNGLIDRVANVNSNFSSQKNATLFEYKISRTIEEIKHGAKSRYYPVELSVVLKQIKEEPGKYAIVGLPCFIKAIHLLMKYEPILKERIKFCIGLVCGHLKSAHFASMWGWQLGIHPDNLKSINFRNKIEGIEANQYGVTVTEEKNGEEKTIISPSLNQLFGSNWGWGLFKYKACDFCDDVLAETADITIGDAWLPQYVKDSYGTNVVVVRNGLINDLLIKANSESRISLNELSPDEVIKSQSSSFLHRREGLAYRLYLADQKHQWRPIKRIDASDKLVNNKVKKRQQLRMKIGEQSHIAFQKAFANDSFEIFKYELQPLLHDYQKLYRQSLILRIKNKIKNIWNL